MIRGKAINYGSAAWVNHTYQNWKCNHEKNLTKLQKYTIHQGTNEVHYKIYFHLDMINSNS